VRREAQGTGARSGEQGAEGKAGGKKLKRQSLKSYKPVNPTNPMNSTNPRNQYPLTSIQYPPNVECPISLSSPIQKKIAWARSHCESFGKALLGDQEIAGLLDNLKEAVAASRREMAQTGIVEICRRCDREEGGSCCGAGIENRYDACLLLINCLLGVHLPEERRQSDSCFFSVENGCLLMARHIICINYLCKNVTDQVDPCRIATVREKEGEEVNALFVLHERIKTVLKQWT